MKDLKRFLEILEEPVPYGDVSPDEDAEACEELLRGFTESEAEELACVSYAYWAVRRDPSAQNTGLGEDTRRKAAALKEIRRHYVGEGRQPAKALAAIREALDYRREYDINTIRSCFYENNDTTEEDSDNNETSRTYRSLILEELRRQPMVVRGVDRVGRSLIYKPPRGPPSSPVDGGEADADADKGFLLAQIYTAERGMATNEFESGGREELLAVVFQFGGYSRANTPAASTVIRMLKVLQRCYPERLGVLVVSNPPFWLRGLFHLAWPLLSEATAEKLRFPATGALARDEFEKLVGRDNTGLREMLASGSIASSVDFAEYTGAPFYARFEPAA